MQGTDVSWFMSEEISEERDIGLCVSCTITVGELPVCIVDDVFT